MVRYLLFYLILAGLTGCIFLYSDKIKAKKSSYRTSEKTLHLMELIGGVFAMLPLMYIIRHKNRKTSYYLLTYFIFIVWIAVVWAVYKYS